MGHSIGDDRSRGHFARSALAGRADHLDRVGIHARAFFDLQLDLARRAAALAGMSLEQAVFEYTNCYIRFGLGRHFDAAHGVWQEYVRGLRVAADPGEWTYGFYRRRPPGLGLPAVEATFGCFSYGRLGEDRIRLHFGNAETDDRSPLGADRASARREELAALFAHVKREERRPVRVVGASWLYNLEAYRRLFPGRYLDTARVVHGRLRHMPLWGQFLDRHGEVKPAPAAILRARLDDVASVEDLDRCFPLPVLGVEAPASDFFEHHGL